MMHYEEVLSPTFSTSEGLEYFISRNEATRSLLRETTPIIANYQKYLENHHIKIYFNLNSGS